jgi:hypothetical protein
VVSPASLRPGLGRITFCGMKDQAREVTRLGRAEERRHGAVDVAMLLTTQIFGWGSRMQAPCRARCGRIRLSSRCSEAGCCSARRRRWFKGARPVSTLAFTVTVQSMHDPCMATKTISLELDAYEALRRAKQSERESFSSVVRRAHWSDVPPAAGEILRSLQAAVKAGPSLLLPDKELDRMARRHRTTRARPRWQER